MIIISGERKEFCVLQFQTPALVSNPAVSPPDTCVSTESGSLILAPGKRMIDSSVKNSRISLRQIRAVCLSGVAWEDEAAPLYLFVQLGLSDPFLNENVSESSKEARWEGIGTW